MKFKPCPCCGGELKEVDDQAGQLQKMSVSAIMIECQDCPLQFRRGGRFRTDLKLREAANRRVSEEFNKS